MNPKKRLTKEEVDNEIRKLKDSHQNGNEDIELYAIKIDNLKTLRQMVVRGDQEWQKIQENPQQKSLQ